MWCKSGPPDIHYHGDSSNKNNCDGVDDGGVNIKCDDDDNCGDFESILNCGEDKDSLGDSIDDGGVNTNGGSDSDFGDGKTRVGCSDNTAGNDGNSNDDGSGINTNDNDCDDEDDSDTDGDNDDNVADGDKDDGGGNDADGGSNGGGGGGNDEGGDNVDSDAKDGCRGIDVIDFDLEDDIDFEDDDGVKNEFFQSNFVSISTIFDVYLKFPGSIRCKQS